MRNKRWLLLLSVVLVSMFVAAEAKSQTTELAAFENRWAILVGVGAYPKGSGLPPLERPRSDVEQLRDVLATRGAFDRIKTLVDKHATRDRLKAAFDDLRKNVKENDLVLFYFSGRGARVKELYSAAPEGDGLNECLLLHDSMREEPETYLRDVDLVGVGRQFLGSLRAKRTVIIIDACYTAGSGDESRVKAITTADDAAAPGVERDGIKNNFMAKQTTVILEACAPDSETRDGVFTPKFVEALEGKADEDADGIITLQDTADYLQAELEKKLGLEPTYIIAPLVKIDSQPSDAEVFVDNDPLLDDNRQPVRTPVFRRLPVGDYQIELRKWGYHPLPDPLRVSAPGKRNLSLTLPPVSIKGRLVFKSYPFFSSKPAAGAKVRLVTLGVPTETDANGNFVVFDKWEKYAIQADFQDQVEVRDDKEGNLLLDAEYIPVELGVAFQETRDISIARFIRNPVLERRIELLQNVGIGMAILVGGIGTMVWFWVIRPARIAAYREQNYPAWENNINIALQTSGVVSLDSIDLKHRNYVTARYIKENGGKELVSDPERIADLGRIYELWKDKISTALRTSGSASLDSIHQKHRGYVQERYREAYPDVELVYSRDGITYRPKIAERIANFDQAWKAAQANLPGDTKEQLTAFREAIERVTDILWDALESDRADTEADFDRLYGYLVNSPPLRLNLPDAFPLIYVQCERPTHDDLDALIDLMRELRVPQRWAFVTVFSNSAHVQDELDKKGLRPAFAFVVLDEENLRDILIAENPRDLVRNIILSQVELTLVSPYVAEGPVSFDVFFGREAEITRILQTLLRNNIALLGGRRIGKTSILHRIRAILAEGRPVAGFDIATENIQLFPLYLNCQGTSSYETFLRRATNQWNADALLESLKDFDEFVWGKRREQGRSVAILLDEADAILTYDINHENQLFGMFRALSEGGLCRFVFTGERLIHSAMLDPFSPLFNFCRPQKISYLDRKGAGLLVSEPMKRLGIRFEDETNIIARILKLTSCHPRMVQWVCSTLVENISGEETLTITMAHLEAVEASRDFQDEFIRTVWGQRTPLEQLIGLLIIDADAPMSAGEIGDRLKVNGLNTSPSELDTMLNLLELTTVLTEKNGSYRFLASEFPRIFRETRDVKYLIRTIKGGI